MRQKNKSSQSFKVLNLVFAFLIILFQLSSTPASADNNTLTLDGIDDLQKRINLQTIKNGNTFKLSAFDRGLPIPVELLHLIIKPDGAFSISTRKNKFLVTLIKRELLYTIEPGFGSVSKNFYAKIQYTQSRDSLGAFISVEPLDECHSWVAFKSLNGELVSLEELAKNKNFTFDFMYDKQLLELIKVHGPAVLLRRKSHGEATFGIKLQYEITGTGTVVYSNPIPECELQGKFNDMGVKMISVTPNLAIAAQTQGILHTDISRPGAFTNRYSIHFYSFKNLSTSPVVIDFNSSFIVCGGIDENFRGTDKIWQDFLKKGFCESMGEYKKTIRLGSKGTERVSHEFTFNRQDMDQLSYRIRRNLRLGGQKDTCCQFINFVPHPQMMNKFPSLQKIEVKWDVY